MKAGSHHRKLPLKKNTEGDEEKEATASLAAPANEVSVDAAAAEALLEFHIKREFLHFAPDWLRRDFFKMLRWW